MGIRIGVLTLAAAWSVAIGPCALSKGRAMERVQLSEDFSTGMGNWWVEGGERVWVEDGRLHVKADPPQAGDGYVCTVWCKTPIHGDVRVEFDAHVLSSHIEANNVNFFMMYSDPSGAPLTETKSDRASGGYKLYHGLNGYIFTFLKDFKGEGGPHPDGSAKARVRARRCPGFRLLAECFGYHCERGRTYHVVIEKADGRLSYSVDGQVTLRAVDPDPLHDGLIGLRTFRTYLWWDNIRVTQLGR